MKTKSIIPALLLSLLAGACGSSDNKSDTKAGSDMVTFDVIDGEYVVSCGNGPEGSRFYTEQYPDYDAFLAAQNDGSICESGGASLLQQLDLFSIVVQSINRSENL